jgi:hypothetical protein
LSIRRYFDELKLRLIIDPSVELFEVISEKIEEKNSKNWKQRTQKQSKASTMRSQMINRFRSISR